MNTYNTTKSEQNTGHTLEPLGNGRETWLGEVRANKKRGRNTAHRTQDTQGEGICIRVKFKTGVKILFVCVTLLINVIV